MSLITLPTGLFDALSAKWNSTCVLVIDEEDRVAFGTVGQDSGKIKKYNVQKAQKIFCAGAVQKNATVYICKQAGLNIANTVGYEGEAADGAVGAWIPGASLRFLKGAGETNALCNVQLQQEIAHYDTVVITGQSTNACCAATARGAAALGKTIYTSPRLLRGGSFVGDDKDQPEYNNCTQAKLDGQRTASCAYGSTGKDGSFVYGWPEGTIVCPTT